MDKDLLKSKIYFQKVKNCMKYSKGIKTLHIFENNENERLDVISKKYIPLTYSGYKTPDSVISFKSTDSQIIEWIKAQMGLNKNEIYYFYCGKIWVEIEITDLDMGIMSLFRYGKWLDFYGDGFLLVDSQMKTMFEAGSDSRDEYNYLFDKYILVDICKPPKW